MHTEDANSRPGQDLNVAYDAKGTVSAEEFDRAMRRYRAESERAVAAVPGTPGVVYDQHSGERLDVLGTPPHGDSRPVFVFLHGGYFTALSRHDSAFMAGMLHDHGVATVVPDYTLTPAVSVEEIVRQVRAAVAWVYHHGPEHGLDPRRIVVGGSSAGGHLTGATMVPGWQRQLGLPEGVVTAAMPVSGLFDLRPMPHIFANEWLGLTGRRAAALSPVLAPPEGDFPAVIARAEHEASGFVEQTHTFHQVWAARPGVETDLLVIPERHHFDVILDLADPETRLSRALLALFAHSAPR